MKRNLNVATLMSTFKLMTNVAMVLLFATTILTSCSGEFNNPHPAQASSLMGSMNESQGHGWAQVEVEAHASDASGNPISAEAHVRYETVKEVEVENEEELGLPVIITPTADGNFTTNNGNVITREESHSANGVTMNVAGGFPQEGSLGERTDEGDQIRQVVYAKISDEAFATATLPENFIKEWRDSKTSVVEYHRIWKKKAAPVEVTYRKSLVLDLEDTKGGIYADLLVEKLQGETVLEKWSCYGVMATWGEYKPQVSAQSVSSFEFTTHDKAGENKELEADVPGLGDKGTFTRKNVRHTAETFEVQFPSAADAEGNTIRPVRGQIDVWLYTYEFVNPEDNHREVFEVEFSVESTKSEVNPNTNAYERTIVIKVNGQVVDTQNGSVQLTIG